MAETPQAAMNRAVGPLLSKIAGDDLATSDQLEPGQMVKAAGEWFTVDQVTEAGDLILLHGGHRMFYKVTEGERFAFHDGPF